MMLRPKYMGHILILSIVIIVLSQPSLIIGVQNLTPIQAYPTNSLVITDPATANYPGDLAYCYEGQNSISVSVVFYNVAGDASWLNVAITEFASANISMTCVAVHHDVGTGSLYDFEYESRLTNYRTTDGADLVISFTALNFEPQSQYSGLAGYSRVQSHLSVISMKNMQTDLWSQAIACHEMSHCLGYIPAPSGHSSDPNSLMYPTFSGSNIHLTAADIAILVALH